MKKIIGSVLLICLCFIGFSQEQKNNNVSTVNLADKVYTSVEQMPVFPGGVSAMAKYVSEHIIYPEEALKQEITGRVVMKFMVDTMGNTTHIEILKDIGSGCGKEAVRIIANMPRWKPGRQNGIAVKVNYTLPVTFRLPSENGKLIDSLMTDTTFVNKIFRVESYSSWDAQFPGGQIELKNYIDSHLEYPESAKNDSIEGDVAVRFIVDKDGSILYPEITNNKMGRGCGQAAIKLIQSMPKWKPGIRNGQPVRMLYFLSIPFKLPK